MDSNAASTPLLEIDGLVAGYGSVPALHGVSFTVADGSCVAVLGPNGAGKSTLARAIGGFLTPMDGRVVFDGVDITNMPPHEVSRLGLVRLPETRGIFPSLTVEENLTLGLMRAQTKSERKRGHGASARRVPAPPRAAASGCGYPLGRRATALGALPHCGHPSPAADRRRTVVGPGSNRAGSYLSVDR